jgi:hypothetical protein
MSSTRARSLDSARCEVIAQIDALAQAGLAVRYPDGLRLRLLTGEGYVFTEQGIVRID